MNSIIIPFFFLLYDQVLRERKNGCGILVSQVPKKSEAFFMLRGPSEVVILPVMLNFFAALLIMPS